MYGARGKARRNRSILSRSEQNPSLARVIPRTRRAAMSRKSSAFKLHSFRSMASTKARRGEHRLRFEWLEPRQMFSLPAASGAPIVLDTQLTTNKSDLSVDVAPNGDFAFAWLDGASLACAEYTAAGVAKGTQNASFSWASGVYYPRSPSAPPATLSSPSPRALAARKTFTFSCSPPRELPTTSP